MKQNENSKPENSNKKTRQFTSKFDESMKAAFKKERKKRKQHLVLIQTDDGKNFYGVNKQNEKVLLDGSYAYITKENSDLSRQIIAWPKSQDKHNDTCHFGLAKYASSVLYAGEVIFSLSKRQPKFSTCVRFDNASGTYRPSAAYKEQAGFPVDQFVAPNFSF